MEFSTREVGTYKKGIDRMKGVIIYLFGLLVIYLYSKHICENNNFLFLDRTDSNILKGIAILLVVICHLGTKVYGTRITTPMGGIGVALFLFLSGYGMEKSYLKHGIQDFWIKRIISVYLPYFIIEFITIPLRSSGGIKTFILDVLLINPQHPFGWYLNYLLLWYIVFYLISKLRFLNKYRELMFFIVAVCSFLILSSSRAEQSLSFIFGVYFARKDMQEYIKLKYCILCLSVGSMSLVIKQLSVTRMAPNLVMNFNQLLIKLSFMIAIVGIVYLVKNKIKWRFFAPFGTVSYELYLIHGYTLKIFNMQQIRSQLVLGAIFVIATATLTILYYYICRLCQKKLRTIIIKPN